MPRRTIQTDAAPAAVGPYAQAVEAGGFVFCSGQIPLDPATGALVEGDIAACTRRCLENLAAVLGAAGLSLRDVVKTTIYLTDLADFAAVNEAYARHFPGEAPPARACVEVRRLPKDAPVEIEAVAAR
jgi:2-iminobutanoate/2-iminopropanoate deaminase